MIQTNRELIQLKIQEQQEKEKECQEVLDDLMDYEEEIEINDYS